MRYRILTAIVFLSVFGMLAYQRLDQPEQHLVTVRNIQGDSAYTIGEQVPRGAFLATEDEYLSVTIGPDRVLFLAPRTTIELKRLFLDEVVLDMTRGRMVLISEDPEVSTIIDTNHTTHEMLDGSVTMINFDFLETVQIIPLSAELNSTLTLINEPLMIADPVSIHETDPVSWEYLTTDLRAGEAVDFYNWTGLLNK